MAKEIVKIPDLGGAEDVEVIEISVAPGDQVSEEQALMVLESDKATMDFPSPIAGKVIRVLVKEGDTVSVGSEIVEVELDGDDSGGSGEAEDSTATTESEQQETASDDGDAATENAADSGTDSSTRRSLADSQQESVKVFQLPDIGTEDQVDLIEFSVAVGDTVEEGQALGLLESDKATMDVPAPFAGEVVEFLVKEGDKVSTGTPFAKIRTISTAADVADQESATEPAQSTSAADAKDVAKEKSKSDERKSEPAEAETADSAESHATSSTLSQQTSTAQNSEGGKIYAGPAVRQLARELGVPLERVKGNGPKGRIQKEDLTGFVREAASRATEAQDGGGDTLPAMPEVDHSQFGDTELVPMTKIQRLTAVNMRRSWLNAPHVTHFDDADITDLEAFRKSLKAEGEQRKIKITPLPFLLQASARALRTHTQFNRSLHSDGKHFVQKDYIHVGVAVDTPRGLLVPVIRDVDKKGLWELAEETAELAAKARDGKLSMAEMQGGCFTISSLGAIGGTGFTPIINIPEVSILAVSRAEVRPVWDGEEFVPRQMLPLALSYDHRAINGADAGRFMTCLVEVLSDLRRLLL